MILTRSPNNGHIESQLANLSLLNEVSSSRSVINSIDLLTKRIPWKTQTIQVFAETKCCSLQTDSGFWLLMITPTQLMKHEKVKLVAIWSLHFYVLVFLDRKVLSRLLKVIHKHQPSHKMCPIKFDLQLILFAKYSCKIWYRTCGVANQYLIWF